MKNIFLFIFALFVLILFYASGLYSYLLFHTLAESFAVIIACGIFMVAWNSRRYVDNHYLLFIGIGYLFIGILDLAHMLSYKGMNILHGYDADVPTQLWIAARYMESLTLLIAPAMLFRRIRPSFSLMGYGVVTLLVLLSIFHWRIFPRCFLEDAGGLTPFKKTSEYLICLFFLASGALILKWRRLFNPIVLRWLLASIALRVLSELTFTTYAGPYDFVNMLGHHLKVVSFFCVYKAIIQTSLANPYELLFRDLKQSKERYQSLFVHMIDGFADHELVLDNQGKPVDYRYLEVNSAFEEITGLKGVVGKCVTEIIPDIHDDPVDWIGIYGKVALTGESTRMESFSKALGRWYAITAYSYQKGRFVTIFEDISQRKLSQDALRWSEARFKLLSDTAGRLLATEDPQGLVNDLCLEVMAYLNCQTFFNFLVDAEAEKLHLNAYAGIPDEEARKIEWLDFGVAVCGCVARDRQRIIAEDILHTPDPRTELIKTFGIQAYCCHPLMVQGRLIGTLAFGTRLRPRFASEEVTLMRTVADQAALAMQRIQTQRDLRNANDFLEQKIRDRTIMLANTVDSLEAEVQRREKVEAELMLANKQLAERADQLRALSAELTMAEQRERKRLAKVLHDGLQQHLAVAKLQLGGVAACLADGELQKNTKDIESLLAESIKMSRSLSAELSPPVLFEGGLKPGLEWLVRWVRDKHQLHVDLDVEHVLDLPEDVNVLLFESVRELLFNIVKHAGTPRAQVRLESPNGNGTLQIIVKDEGAGFDIDHMKPIGGGHGGGFGLFSIRERIGLIGGHFEVRSAIGQGSRFILTVPQRQTSFGRCENDDSTGAFTGASCPAGGATLRVLIADDHELFRDGLSRLVGREPDLEVVGHAADGLEAIELTRHLMPDVVLMDINMPGISGIEATRRIHKEMPHVRIIGLSMHTDHEHAKAMGKAGAVGYKTKACPAPELLAAIRACVKQADGFAA